MRNALILLAVVALLILAVGALNNGTAFDVDYVAGTVSAVSLFWVSAVIAALVFVVGLAAAWFAKSAASGSRRKLEAELQSTYERLREAEALAARPAPAAEPEPAAVVVAATEVAEAETVVAVEEATVVAGADETVLAREDVTLVAGEEATVVADEPGADVASDVPGEPGEQTAVTMAGADARGRGGRAGGTPARRGGDGPVAESSAEGAAGEGEAGRPGS